MDIKPGTRMRAAVGEAEVIVVKCGAGVSGELRCGGHAMLPMDATPPDGLEVDAAFAEPTVLGKRYTDASGELELLCTKAGAAALSLDDEPLQLKDAKPLPSSD